MAVCLYGFTEQNCNLGLQHSSSPGDSLPASPSLIWLVLSTEPVLTQSYCQPGLWYPFDFPRQWYISKDVYDGCTQRTNTLKSLNFYRCTTQESCILKVGKILLMIKDLGTMWNSYSGDIFFLLHTQAAWDVGNHLSVKKKCIEMQVCNIKF